MKNTQALTLFFSMALMLACGNKQLAHDIEPTDSSEQTLELDGDSTIYGLVCDGTNDTLLIYLPVTDISANPDTLDILTAVQSHHVYGRPKVGDKIAILRNSQDTTVADIVIDTDNLLGSWCYLVKPELRQRADMSEKMMQQYLSHMPDSVRDSLLAPREYGIQIKSDNAARSLGRRRAHQEDNTPVVYPKTKRYTMWHIHNCQLLLTETAMDSTGQRHIQGTDTAQFVMMHRDTLVLQFGNHLQGYYRKVENDSL